MQYEADQNMVFNYLMVSGLAAATDLFEKNGTGMTGGKSFIIIVKFTHIHRGKLPLLKSRLF